MALLITYPLLGCLLVYALVDYLRSIKNDRIVRNRPPWSKQ